MNKPTTKAKVAKKPTRPMSNAKVKTVKDAAAYLKMSVPGVQSAIRRGRLEANIVRVEGISGSAKGFQMIPVKSLNAFIKDREKGKK